MFNSSIKLCIGILLLAISAAPTMAGNNSGAAFSIWPDTGQTKCYNDTEEIPCPAPGEAFHGQDAQYYGPARSYTKLNEQGNPLPHSATSYAMVRDNVTSLIWEIKNNKDSTADFTNPHDADNRYTWCDTNPDTNGGLQGTCGGNDTQNFIGQLNSGNGFGGYTNWRMPTIKELATLVDNTRIYPAIDPIFAATTQASPYWSLYWSSTTYAGLAYEDPPGGEHAWCVNFNNGHDYYYGKSSGLYVRAVHGGQVQSEDKFVDNQDGTVTDTATCLQWQKATMDTKNGVGPDTYNWHDALEVSENLSLAGHSDWRLPDRNELHSLVDYSHSHPAIDTVFAATTLSPGYWSSTTNAGYPGNAWRVYFHYGGEDPGYGKSSYPSYSVRAVRGSQCEVVPVDDDEETDPTVNDAISSSPIFFPIKTKDGKTAVIYIE